MAEGNHVTSSQESVISQGTYDYILQEFNGQLPVMDDIANVDCTASNPNTHLWETIVNVPNNEMQFLNMETSDVSYIKAQFPNAMEELSEFNGNNIIQVSRNHLSDQENQMKPSILPGYLIENYEGEYSFRVSFKSEEQVKAPKWIYSTKNNKLYIEKEVYCPVNFSTKHSVPPDAYIRARAVFISPDQASEVVERCLNHSQGDIKNGLPGATHLIRCENKLSHYETDFTKQNSVVVPYENPAVGQQFSCYLYKFMCFTSCSGGPNRRPILVVFTLERRGKVIGCQKVELKVCACPTRDFNKDEKTSKTPVKINQVLSTAPETNQSSQIKRSNLNRPDPLKFVKKLKSERKERKPYIIKVYDENSYEFLKGMKKYYAFYRIYKMKNPHPDDIKRLIYSSTSSEVEEK